VKRSARARKGPRGLLPALARVLFALCVGLSAAELTFRLRSGPDRGLILVPSDYPGLLWTHGAGARYDDVFPTRTTFQDYPNRIPSGIEFSTGSYAFDNLGFRDDRDVDLARLHENKVVLCLGDSTTLGAMVPAEAAYPKRLEGLLRRARGNDGLVVLNAGVSGYNLAQYRADAERLAPLIKPDVLVVALYMNDAVPWPKHQRLMTWLNAHSLLYRNVRNLLHTRAIEHHAPGELRARLARTLDPRSADAIARYSSYSDEFGGFLDDLRETNDLDAWRTALADLDAIKALCDANGIRFVAAVFPAQFQVNFGYDFPEPQRTIDARMAALGVPHCDMAPIFRREAATTPLYAYLTDVAHFNARGHELVARCLAPLVSKALDGRGP
jgi:lysophospholipase L1-like esterase